MLMKRRVLVVLLILSSLTVGEVMARELPKQTGLQWAPYLEWAIENPSLGGNPFEIRATATFVHSESGEKRTTGMFYDGGDIWKFRFAGTKPGRWTFITSSPDSDLDGWQGSVEIEANPTAYGFVTHVGNKWVRPIGSGEVLEPFIPQFVMYEGPQLLAERSDKLDADIETFFVEHGFNGFHTAVFCRWFNIDKADAKQLDDPDPNPDPRTFEALETLIRKTHAAGGVVHIWAWGDEQRHMTPRAWGVNGEVDRRLQRYIAARLGPLPGWTMGYGFDLWEWVKGSELTEWHDYMTEQLGWTHMLGARSTKNTTEQISEELDYASYEQHRPTYKTYVETINARPHKPAFSEDRFRIRQSERYAFKDYSFEMTRRGLWHSAMAGGVANIWGNLQGNLDANMALDGSFPYPDPPKTKTYAEFFRKRFLIDMDVENSITDGVCLKSADGIHVLFYKEDAEWIHMDLSKLASPLVAIAVDTNKSYAEIGLGKLHPEKQSWQAPYKSDWAVAVGVFAGRDKRK